MKYLKILLLLLFMGVLQTKGQEDSVMFKVAYKATLKVSRKVSLKKTSRCLRSDASIRNTIASMTVSSNISQTL